MFYSLATKELQTQRVVRKVLLICGIISSLLYIAMNIFVPMQYEGYNSASQTVSELSAIDTPTRPLWVSLGIVYTLLVIAFGLGVWRLAGQNRSLRIVGGAMIVNVVIGLFWPPMHQREVLAIILLRAEKKEGPLATAANEKLRKKLTGKEQ